MSRAERLKVMRSSNQDGINSSNSKKAEMLVVHHTCEKQNWIEQGYKTSSEAMTSVTHIAYVVNHDSTQN